jgi:hypothetical protein
MLYSFGIFTFLYDGHDLRHLNRDIQTEQKVFDQQDIVNIPAPKDTQLFTFKSHLLLTGKLDGIQSSQKHK